MYYLNLRNGNVGLSGGVVAWLPVCKRFGPLLNVEPNFRAPLGEFEEFIASIAAVEEAEADGIMPKGISFIFASIEACTQPVKENTIFILITV